MILVVLEKWRSCNGGWQAMVYMEFASRVVEGEMCDIGWSWRSVVKGIRWS